MSYLLEKLLKTRNEAQTQFKVFLFSQLLIIYINIYTQSVSLAGIVKTHNLAFIECETLQAVFSKDMCPNSLTASAKYVM